MTKPDFTKNYIAETFKDMVESMPYNDVTVQGIVEACEINRKTFYYHFFNKADLATYLFRTELARALEDRFSSDILLYDSGIEDDRYRKLPLYYLGDPSLHCSEFLQVFSYYIKDSETFYRKLFNSPDWGYFNNYIFTIYRPQLERDLRFLFNLKNALPSDEELNYLSAYFTNGSVVWVIHRHVTKQIHYSDITKSNLSTIIVDSMKGVVAKQSHRLQS